MVENVIPKVFISYSWTKSDLVLQVANRLMSHGVEVVLDKWDLKEGQDKYVFMEQCVNNSDITKVLIFCDKTYTEKANNRTGGVGDETVIISSEVYGKVTQEKFIPIITERDEDGKEYVPAYIKTRIYIDFSNPDIFEEEYEKLVRNIYNKPLYRKPKLGKQPEWLEEEKSDFQIQLPKVGEYAKETKLAFEKEVLGVYISGHPLEEYEEQWQKAISATTLDFQLDEESNHSKVHDGAREIIGGFITEKTMKATKTNQMMAFVTLEDLLGTVEVVVFPRDYEKNRNLLEVDRKVFIKGRVSEEDDKPSKLICEKVVPFNQIKRELWIQFPDKADYLKNEQIVYGYLADYEGEDEVIIYCQAERAVKRLPKNRNIQIAPQVLSKLMNHYGEKRVKVVEKTIENKI